MQIDLSGKHILITGGTSALGSAFVRRATEEGAHVYFTYHKSEEIAKTLMALGAHGFQVNLCERSQITALKKKIQEHTKLLDALICNAAIVRDRTVQNMTDEEWDETLSVDLDSVYFLTKKFLSFLFKKRGSKIFNIVSRVAYRGGFGEANYAAAKAGLIAFTKSLAKELGKKEILVNALNPGFMESGMTENLPDEIFQKNIDESSIQKISDPLVVSDFLIYLTSDRFQGVTGQVFHHDSRSLAL